MAELKPCPFCGGEAVIRVLMGKEYIRPMHKKNCVMEIDTWLNSSLHIKKQIKAWNRRAEDGKTENR
jgi:hypothetical protein